MRTCVIFNPAARGDKARHFRDHLTALSAEVTLKPTYAAGAGRPLAAEAVREGFEVVVAAGGDGTVNEVINGIAEVEGGLARTRVGVLPLGTVNVFAKELGLPTAFDPAWRIIQSGGETRIDLPEAEFAVFAPDRLRPGQGLQPVVSLQYEMCFARWRFHEKSFASFENC